LSSNGETDVPKGNQRCWFHNYIHATLSWRQLTTFLNCSIECNALPIGPDLGEVLPDTLLAHIGPLDWEYISFNGDYVRLSELFKDGFRPLRNPRSAFLDAA